jgi:hypothetical protein
VQILRIGSTTCVGSDIVAPPPAHVDVSQHLQVLEKSGFPPGARSMFRGPLLALRDIAKNLVVAPPHSAHGGA